MNKSLVLLVITLLGAHSAAARRSHGRRIDHNRFTANLGRANEDDRGDEYRELNSSVAREQEAKVADQEEKLAGYNSHIVVSTPTSLVEGTTNFGSIQKDFASGLEEVKNSFEYLGSTLSPLRGYGFKFSAVVPEDIRYTFEKNGDQHDSVSFVEQAEVSAAFGEATHRPDNLEGIRQDAEIQFDPRPAVDPEVPIYTVNNDAPIITEAHSIPGNNEDSYGHGELNIGSGLTSIAQGSADRAQSAVINQQIAAQQAAFVAKNGLAQSAIHSAATAIAALAGKEVLVNALEKETQEVQKTLDYEIDQLQVTKKTTSSARHAAQQAAYHVSVLAAALNNAQQLVEQAEANEKLAAAELASQEKMVGDAKGRLNSIVEQLTAAHIDFEATKDAATKATEAAEQAQQNAHLISQHESHHRRRMP